jgi:outer membrane protein OmpA-like peptidoglycan-associated protein
MRIVTTVLKYRYLVLAGTVLSAVALPQWNTAFGQGAQDGRIIVAETAEEKKKKEQQKAKPQPKPQPKAEPKPQPKPQPKVEPKPQPKPQPRVEPKPQPKPQPKGEPKPQPKPQPKAEPKPQPKPLVQPKAEPKVQPKVQSKPQTDSQPKPKVQSKPQTDSQPKPKVQSKPQTETQPKAPPKIEPRGNVVQPKTGPLQKKEAPAAQTNTPKPKFIPQKDGKQFVKKKGDGQKGNVKQIKEKRKVEVVGGMRVTVEPGNRRIFNDGKRMFILHDDSARLRRWGNARFEIRGKERYTIIQRGPYQIVTVTDSNGRLIRRFRRYPNGREVIFIDNRPRFGRGALGVGAAALFLGLAAPAITIPRNRYIVEADDAPPALLYETLSAPPLTAMERPYSLDEVRSNVELRDRVRSVDLNTINFSTGSWEITPEQYPQLQAIAEAILKLLSENADTVIMLEGHTDAVGTPEDNLSLSDRRAESVAEILTGQFQIPPENLVTQGYGEQHLRVKVDGPSRENRRVQVRNITQILGEAPDQDPSQGQPPG